MRGVRYGSQPSIPSLYFVSHFNTCAKALYVPCIKYIEMINIKLVLHTIFIHL